MSHQPPLRILTVAPQPATRTPADIQPDAVPVPGGGWLIPEGLSPEERRAMHVAAYRASLRDAPHETTARTEEARRASMRSTLGIVGRRSGDTALHVAGRLYVAHGERARAVLMASRDAWPVPVEMVDGYLERAGLPAWGLL